MANVDNLNIKLGYFMLFYTIADVGNYLENIIDLIAINQW
jgi:hypothetical protein